MKRHSIITLLVLVVAMVMLSFTSCDLINDLTSKIPGIGKPEHVHTFSEPTCTAPATCEECGATEGEALGHEWTEADCDTAKTCSVCGETEGEALGHKWNEADCYTAKTCSVCGETEGEALGHTFSDATCEAPKTCSGCGLTEGEALGHTFSDATCVAPKTCSVCGATEGEALGHTFSDATCEAPKTCSVCGATEGEALGHTFSDATCVAPKTCSVCGATEGEALGHTPGAEATCTAGQTCTVCGVELVAKLDHIDENLDIACDREGCKVNIAPQAETLLSNFTANKLGSTLSTSGMYYVVGTIVEVLDAKNGVFYLDDGTGEKFYFRLPKNADGVSHSSWEVKLVVGDKVQVYGKINKFTSSSAPNGQYWPSIQGGVVTILEQHPHDFTFKPATCSDPAYCACGQSHGEPLGCADTDGDQLCDDCGRNVNYVYEYVELRTDNGSGVHDATALTYTWSNDNFSIQVAKASGGNLYVTSNNHMRLYKNNQLIITNKNGLVVKTITVYVTNATQITNFEKLLTGYTYVKNEEKLTVTFEVSALETLTLVNSGSTTQIKGVEFGYEKPEEPALSNAVLDLTTKDNRTYYDAADKQVWEANGIKLTNTKGNGTSNVQDKAPFSAWAKGYIIIEGKGIKTIQVVCSTTTLGTFFSRSLKAVENPNFTYSNSGTTYTIVFNEEVDIFELYLTDQTAFKKITINPEA